MLHCLTGFAAARRSAALGLALVSACSFAQNFKSARVSPVAGDPRQLVTADFNHDGRPDLVYQDAAEGGSLHVLLGQPDGTFVPRQVIPIPHPIGTTITVADVNGDGIPDLLLGYTGHISLQQSTSPVYTPSITVLLNTGDGSFGPLIENSAPTASYPAEINHLFAVADFDGDGKPDLAFVEISDVHIMRGDGAGHFTAKNTISNVAFVGDVFAADVNGDGRPDLIASATYGISVLINTGNGFAPAVTYEDSLYSAADLVSVRDFDGDGHPDLIYPGNPQASTTPVFFRHGNADGTFGDPQQIGSFVSASGYLAGIADTNGDGKADLLVAGDAGLSVSLSQGASGILNTQPPVLYATSGSLYTQAVTADFNGTGRPVVALPADHAIVFLESNADGTFNAAPAYEAPYLVSGLFVEDANHDGIPDLVVADYAVYPAVYLGRGDGSFQLPPITTGNGGQVGCGFPIYPGDFNGDGITDYFCWIGVQFGNTDGTFGNDLTLPLSVPGSGSNFWNGFWNAADFNNDGLTDVAGSYGNGIAVAVSTAPSTYQGTGLLLKDKLGALASGDFDGDGCRDLATVQPAAIVILHGDCHGNFAQSDSYPGGPFAVDVNAMPADITAVDLDRDGNLDIVVTNPAQNLVKVLYGRGDGSFQVAPDLITSRSNQYVTAGDLDNDGFPDLVLDGEGLVTVIHGRPGRSFGPESLYAANPASGKPVLADLNRDGNLDIVVPARVGFTFTILLNQAPARVSNLLTASLRVMPEPSVAGQASTVTATFIPVSNTASPKGDILFEVDGSYLGSAPLAGGKATFVLGALSIGTHTLTAAFPGDPDFLAVTAKALHVVNGFPTTVSLRSAPNPAPVGQSVTLTAGVAAADPAQINSSAPLTGMVSFFDGTSLLQAQPLSSSGAASLVTSNLNIGRHMLTAVYSGDNSFSAATSAPLLETISGIATVLSLIANPDTPLAGTPVMVSFSASNDPLATSGAAQPTGSIVVTVDGASFASGTSTGAAGLSFSESHTFLAAGVNNFNATYSGDDINSAASISVIVTVSAVPTTTSLAVSLPTSMYGQPVFYQAHVSVPAGSALTPAGAVLFTFCRGATITTNLDASGTASFLYPTAGAIAEPVGTCSAMASFPGNANLLPSQSAISPLVVTPSPSVTSLGGSPDPAYEGSVVTFTVHVLGTPGPVSDPVTGNPLPLSSAARSGIATLFDGETAIGSLPVTNGKGSFSTATLAVGSHTLTAVYANDADLLPSTSAPAVVSVLPSTFTLSLTPSVMTLKGGQQGDVTVAVSSVGNFSGPLSLTAGGAPEHAAFSFAAASLMVRPTTNSNTVLHVATQIVPTQLAAQPRSRLRGSIRVALSFLVALPFALWGQRRRVPSLLGIFLAAAVLFSATGCTNLVYQIDPVAPGTYVIPVTATDSTGRTATASLTLVITQ